MFFFVFTLINDNKRNGIKVHGINIEYKIIKGYRNDEDLKWEREQAEWNWEHGRYETELWKCSDGLENVSSTIARDAIKQGLELDMLPDKVAEYIKNL